jgi:hypothetical protein
MKRLDSGAANPALNRNFLHGEIVSWPGPDEQREIVAILDAIDRKINLHRKKRAVLDELFKALLHKLMTGQIRVNDLDLPALAAPGSADGLLAGSEGVSWQHDRPHPISREKCTPTSVTADK